MNQTRFDVLQNSLDVTYELLLMPRWQRELKGSYFVLTLIVNLETGADIPFDVYVDRITDGRSKLVYDADEGKGTMTFRTTARIRPDIEESFDIDISFKAGDQAQTRPYAEVPHNFADIVREIREKEVVDELLHELGMNDDES